MRRLKYIFDSKVRPGDIVIHRVSDDTVEYVSEYEPDLTSVVKHRGKSSVPFLAANDNLIKFKAYMVCEWIAERAGMLNKRMGRIVHGNV